MGSGIFKPEDPQMRARAIVEATTHFADPARVASASEGLGGAMDSLQSRSLAGEQLLAQRGWATGLRRPSGRHRHARC